MKKILALLLALVMVLGLAACAPADKADDTKPADTKPADTKPADETTEPAGNGVIPAAELSHDEAVTVKLIVPDNNMLGRDEIMGEAAKYVKEKLNIDLEFVYIVTGDTPETIMSTGAGWDLGYCSAAIFQNLSARNAFLALDDYIEAGYLAYPVENLSDAQKGAHQINGEQVGFAPIKDLMEGWNLIYNKDVIEGELGVSAPPVWQSAWDLVDWWRDIKAAQKGTEHEDKVTTGFGFFYMPSWWQYDGIVGSWNNVMVCTNIDLDNLSSFDGIDPMTAFCPYFTEDFTEWVKLRKQLIDEGIDLGYKRDTGESRSIENGDFLVGGTCGLLEYKSLSEDYELVMTNQKAAYTYTGYVQAVSVVVNRNTENPERVLELMNLMYEDDYWNTLMRCGVEGQDWADANNDGVVEWIGRNEAAAQNDKYWRQWYGNGLSHSLLQGKVDASCVSKDGFTAALKALNQNGIATPHLGFVFDQTPVKDEIAACSAIVAEYVTGQLLYPASVSDVDATMKAFQEKLTASGIEKIVAEVQTQLDAFHAAK